MHRIFSKVSFLLCLLVLGAQAQASDQRLVQIGYLGVEGGTPIGYLAPEGGLDLKEFGLGDGRYSALDGALLGIKDVNGLSRYYQTKFKLVPYMAKRKSEIAELVLKLKQQGVELILLDLPSEWMELALSSTMSANLLFFNLSVTDNRYRQTKCFPQLFHIIPSRAMLTDGLTQYLLKQNWRKWLLVRGPTQADQAYAASLERSAKRFGGQIADVRVWEGNADVRRSAQAEFPLLTAQAQYDVVLVADEQAEFGELLPYHTYLPRPVAGTQGMTPKAWFWSFSQWAATQLNHRFIQMNQRKMNDTDWAAWMAVSIIGESMTRGKAQTSLQVKAYLGNREVAFHGYKGPSLSFRAWNHQLRQNILVTTARARVSVSPQAGYLHQTSKLDSLGFDQHEVTCRLTD